MKRATLIAIISLSTIIFMRLIEYVIRFLNFNVGTEIYYVFSFMHLFAYIGLLSFFITLYKKQ